MSAPAAQRPVSQQLDRPDPEHLAAFLQPRFSKPAQAVHIGKLRLFADTDGQFAVRGHFPVDLVDRLPGHAMKHLVIVRLHAGDAIPVYLPARAAEHGPDFVLPGRGETALRQSDRVIIEQAVFIVNHPALGSRGIWMDTRLLQGFRVHHAAMTAGAGQQNGNDGRDCVQVMPVGHTAHIRKQILVPAPAQQPRSLARRMMCKESAYRLQHPGQRMGMRRQVGHAERIAEAQQVHMRIVKTRADKTALQIDALVTVRQRRQDFRIASCHHKPPVFNEKRLSKGNTSRVNLRVVICRLHRADLHFIPPPDKYAEIIAEKQPQGNALV